MSNWTRKTAPHREKSSAKKASRCAFRRKLSLEQLERRWVLSGITDWFSESQSLANDADARAVRLADLDGDDDLDAFVANHLDDNFVFFNDGSGAFQDSGQRLGGSVRSTDVSLGDVDDDGDIDAVVAVARDAGKGFEVWVNAGNGLFTLDFHVPLQANDPEPRRVELRDLDADGDLDFFAANQGPNQVWLNNGDGTFIASGQSPTWGDYRAHAVQLGDLDGDDHFDAFVVNDFQAHRVWRNDGTGEFSEIVQNPAPPVVNGRYVSLGDVDDDGDLDAFVVNDVDPHQVWINDGNGGFQSNGQQLGNSPSQGVALGDFDLDGDLDAFVSNQNNFANVVWVNDSHGNFSEGQSLGNSASEGVAVGDLDGDGDLDAFVINTSQAHKIWRNEVPRQPEIISIFVDATMADKALPGEAVSLEAAFDDPNIDDTHTATIDWGDGTLTTGVVDQDADTVSGVHTYTTGGIFEITVTVTDDGGLSDTEATSAYVSGVRLSDNGELQVVGTRGKDIVRIWPTHGRRPRGVVVIAHLDVGGGGGAHKFRYDIDAVDSILVIACEGNDHAHLSHRLDVPAQLLGGPGHDHLWGGGAADTIDGGSGNDYIWSGRGDDTITDEHGRNKIWSGPGDDLIRAGDGRDHVWGGSGNDIILGQGGNDFLFGDGGRDILIGGAGRDWIFGSSGSDILVGGTTDHDHKDAALRAIMSKWSSDHAFDVRVSNVRQGGGLNGGFLLNAGSVHDDNERDYMFGWLRRNWVWADSLDRVLAGFDDLVEIDDD